MDINRSNNALTHTVASSLRKRIVQQSTIPFSLDVNARANLSANSHEPIVSARP